MSKYKKTDFNKIQKYVTLYPNEFICGPNNILYCNICSTKVQHLKKWAVDSHRKSEKHIIPTKHSRMKSLFTDSKPNETDRLVKAFMAADIPLKKLQNEKLVDLFDYMNFKLPSESNARRHVNSIALKEHIQLQSKLMNKKVFLIFDETELNKMKYCNVMCGSIEKPDEIWLIKCFNSQNTVNSTAVIDMIEESLKSLNILQSNFILLISDAATYMIKAGEMYKIWNDNFLHITCVAHLIHNCAMRIRGSFGAVDKVIGCIKMLTHKNREVKLMFEKIGMPPTVILTRWSSWLKACKYYGEYFHEIKKIVLGMHEKGVLHKNAKDSVLCCNVVEDLVRIEECYSVLINFLDELECGKYNAFTAFEALMRLKFGSDPVGIKD